MRLPYFGRTIKQEDLNPNPGYLLTYQQVNRLYRILGLPETARLGGAITDQVDVLLDWLEARMGPPNANGGGG